MEANVLPAGYVHLKYGRFDIAQVNPPFSRMLCALPLLLFDVEEDWPSFQNRADLRIEYAFGRDFMRRNAASLQPMLFACRSVAMLFSVLGAVCVLCIARRLYGPLAGFAALAIWCFSPMILGHGATANHDVPGAALLAATFLVLLVAREDPGRLTAALLGLVSGVALLTRTTCAPVIGLWLGLHVLTPLSKEPSMHWRRRLPQSIGVLALALLVLNAGYGFSGTLTRLGNYTFFSAALSGQPTDSPGGNRFRGTPWDEFPVPLPKDYVQGLDLQQRDFESPPFESYLLGEWRPRGWWYYYLVGWAVKTPIGFQALLVAGIAVHLWRWSQGHTRAAELWVLGSAVLVFVLASVECGFTIHYRYVLPAWPFLAVLSGGVFSALRGPRVCGTLASIALALGVVESLLAHPHHIAFFNAWVGGGRAGPRYLLHSSGDWGQDVYAAVDGYRAAVADDQGEPFLLTYGTVTPEMLGVSTQPIPQRADSSHHRRPGELELRPGRYTISVTHLYSNTSCYAYFLRLQPVDRIGKTMPLYELTAADIERLGLNLALK